MIDKREILLVVDKAEDGMTTLDFLRLHGFSKRAVNVLKTSGGLTRDGEILRTVDRLSAGDEVKMAFSEQGSEIVPNPALRAPVVFENEDYVIFDKPPLMPTHPSLFHYNDTLANLFAAKYPALTFRPLNRLDLGTSGLCVCAKNKPASAGVALHKTYYAAVNGEINEAGRISAPIGRTGNSIIKREVRPDGKFAETLYKPVLVKNGRTLLEITLKTGRTHQIRVHMAHIGFPLIGDEMYGGDCSVLHSQALHCGKAEFLDRLSGEQISAESPLPEYIERLFL